VAALIAGLIALASCSTMPTAPASSAGGGPAPELTGTVASVTSSVSLVGSKLIDGRLGGVISVGKWKVVVPRDAYDGIGTITITVPDTTIEQCQLGISPLSLNHFDQEVDLRFRCATLTEANQRYMKWWNPSTSSWVQIKSWTNTSDTTRCAPLKHFSTYATGKAGW
jgi:hypothetical protein